MVLEMKVKLLLRVNPFLATEGLLFGRAPLDHYKQFCDEDCKEEIEWWDGDIQDGGFVSGFRHSWEKEVTFYLHGKERKKRSEKGCIVAKKSSPWIFEFIRCERIKYKQPITVLWGTFSSQQLTPPICFSTGERNEKNGRCLVKWNNDKRWLFKSEFSSVTQSVKRNTAPPNRLSTDEDGNWFSIVLQWKGQAMTLI